MKSFRSAAEKVVAYPAHVTGLIAGALAGGVQRGFYALGYDAGESTTRHHSQLRGGRQQPRSEDALVGAWDYSKMRQECINMKRNDPVVNGLCDRFADNVVGTGVIPQAKTSDKAWNTEAEAWWREWSKIADVRQRLNLGEIQRTIVQSRLIWGDMGLVLLKNGQLQPVEGERINTPDKFAQQENVVNGVKVDKKTGIQLGYYVFGRDRNGLINTSADDWDFRKRENIIYINNPYRFDQVRGIPELASSVNALKDLRDLNESILEKAKIEAFNAYAIQKDVGGPGNLGPRQGGSKNIGSVNYEKFEKGMVHYLQKNEKVQSLAGTTPHQSYFDEVQQILRIVGASLGLPYEFLLLDFSEANFTSSRGALMQAQKTFGSWQRWLAKYMQRMWNWRIAKAIKDGQLRPAPVGVNGVSEWHKVTWSYPEYEWVDPNAEALSQQREFAMGKKSMHNVISRTGADYDDVLNEKVGELRDAATKAAELAVEFPNQTFNWTDIWNSSTSGQQQKAEGSTVKADGGVKEG
jgi:lambda family phage portal protein